MESEDNTHQPLMQHLQAQIAIAQNAEHQSQGMNRSSIRKCACNCLIDYIQKDSCKNLVVIDLYDLFTSSRSILISHKCYGYVWFCNCLYAPLLCSTNDIINIVGQRYLERYALNSI